MRFHRCRFKWGLQGLQDSAQLPLCVSEGGLRDPPTPASVPWKIVKNRPRGRQISPMTATFILLVNGFWGLKDDLVCSKRRDRKDNEKGAAGRLKARWGETEGVAREGERARSF